MSASGGRAASPGMPLSAFLALVMAATGSAIPTTAQEVGRADPASRERPAWVVDGVPDTVWILVEASVATADGDRAKEILRQAERLAREAVAGHEGDVGRRFALAAVLGMRTDVEGGRTKVGLASDLYRELGAVLDLEPEHAQARYMMGRLHAGVRRMNGVTRWLATNLLGGGMLDAASWEEAERHLAFAERHAPEVPDHHLQLARLYVDTGRPDAAAREASHVLAMEAVSPLEKAARREALELADELDLDVGSRSPE